MASVVLVSVPIPIGIRGLGLRLENITQEPSASCLHTLSNRGKPEIYFINV